MRPKKKVLLYCPDPDRSSEVSFVLKVRGFDVYPVVDMASAKTAGKLWDAALVLGGCDLVIAMLQKRQIPVLAEINSLAQRVVKKDCSMAELIEALRMVASRKRGPR